MRNAAVRAASPGKSANDGPAQTRSRLRLAAAAFADQSGRGGTRLARARRDRRDARARRTAAHALGPARARKGVEGARTHSHPRGFERRLYSCRRYGGFGWPPHHAQARTLGGSGLLLAPIVGTHAS